MTDSRVEKLATHYAHHPHLRWIRLQPGEFVETAENVLGHCETAGLTVIDTTDEATVKLVMRVLSEQGGDAGSGMHSWRCEYPDRYGKCDCLDEAARAILAALRGGA